MKTKITSIAMVAALLAATSCSEHWTPPTGSEGSLALGSMTVDVKENANVVVSSGSRAGADVNSFTVRIFDKTGAVAGEWTYGQMPEIVPLEATDGYVVKVESHEVEKAAWDKPYYYGESKSFAIEKNKITEVGTIVAAFSSLKVTVEFGDDLKAMLGDDVKVVIEANDEGLITFTNKEVEAGNAAYFEVVEGSTTMAAHFTGSVNGVLIDDIVPFTGIKAGEHRIVRYGVKVGPEPDKPTGSINPGDFVLDTDVVEVDVNGNVTIVDDPKLDDSDRPGQEDPVTPPGPGPDVPDVPDVPGDDNAIVFTKGGENENLDLDRVNVVTENFGDVIINIDAEKGISVLEVSIITTSENFEITIADFGLNKPFDLANPGDLAETLESLSLPYGPAVKGKTNVPFDITGFMTMLMPFPGDHNFQLRVVDMAGNENSMTLKLKVN